MTQVNIKDILGAIEDAQGTANAEYNNFDYDYDE